MPARRFSAVNGPREHQRARGIYQQNQHAQAVRAASSGRANVSGELSSDLG
jgi:hypothetical protein